MVQTGLLKPHFHGGITPAVNPKVIREGQILELPGVLDPEAQVLGGGRDGPGGDPQGQKHVLQGEARGAVGQAGGGVVMHEDQAHLLVGREAAARERASGRRVVGALRH